MVLRALAGIALAGTYMPGLKALSDRVEGPRQPRAVALYTSSFGIGAALSFLIGGEIGTRIAWEWAFVVAAIGAATAFALVAWALEPSRLRDETPETALLDFRPVYRNRSAMAYILCYGYHNSELFGLRSLVVAFLVFTQGTQGASTWTPSPTVIATLLTLLGVWSSISGNELAMRFGRRQVIFVVMLTSAVLCGFIGFTSGVSYALAGALCMVHGVTIAAESASLTAGVVGTAVPRYRGATMALHSTIGFAFAFVGPLAFGLVLDLAGGESVMGWGLAFASMGVIMAIGPVTLAVLRPAGVAGERGAEPTG